VQAKYSIDLRERLVRLQISGELRAAQLIHLMREIAADPRHAPEMGAIADLREAHGNWDFSEVQRFRDYVVRIAVPNQGRWAAIVRPGALVAAAHVLIVISEPAAGVRIQLFEDGRSALRWVKQRDAEGSRRLAWECAAEPGVLGEVPNL